MEVPERSWPTTCACGLAPTSCMVTAALCGSATDDGSVGSACGDVVVNTNWAPVAVSPTEVPPLLAANRTEGSYWRRWAWNSHGRSPSACAAWPLSACEGGTEELEAVCGAGKASRAAVFTAGAAAATAGLSTPGACNGVANTASAFSRAARPALSPARGATGAATTASVEPCRGAG